MPTLREAADEFLSQKRIAVAGVSRDEKQPANLIYRRLRATGHEVFAVNPNATEVEGDPCFPTVGAIPGGVDGVVVVTTPSIAERVVADCAAAAAGVRRVWLHRGIGPGSTSDAAVAYCREHGISVIPGGCPNSHVGSGTPIPEGNAHRDRQDPPPDRIDVTLKLRAGGPARSAGQPESGSRRGRAPCEPARTAPRGEPDCAAPRIGP